MYDVAQTFIETLWSLFGPWTPVVVLGAIVVIGLYVVVVELDARPWAWLSRMRMMEDAMGAADLQVLAHRVVDELLNAGNIDVVDDVVDPRLVSHSNSDTPIVRDLETIKRSITDYRAAFPDLQITLRDVLIDGMRIALHWSARGTNTGGLALFPPTGQQVTFHGVWLWRVEGGKICESWTYFHRSDLLPLSMTTSALEMQ